MECPRGAALALLCILTWWMPAGTVSGKEMIRSGSQGWQIGPNSGAKLPWALIRGIPSRVRMRLRGGAVDAFSPYSTQIYHELSDYLVNSPEWRNYNEEVEGPAPPPEEEESENAMEDVLKGGEPARITLDSLNATKARGASVDSLAGCVTKDDLPFMTRQELDEEERRENQVRYHDDHPSEFSDECLWCSKRWSKRVKLLAAARDGDSETVLACLEEGAEINGRDVTHMNWTAVHYAAYYGHASTIEILADCGADINAVDLLNWTPLHHAALKGRHDACLALLTCGANATALTEKGKTPLQKAVYLQHVECVKLICEWTDENPQLHIRRVNASDSWIVPEAVRTGTEGDGIDKAEARRALRIAKAMKGEGSSADDSDDSSADQAAKDIADMGKRKTGTNLFDSDDDAGGPEPDRTAEEEQAVQQLRKEYDRRYRQLKNREGFFGQ